LEKKLKKVGGDFNMVKFFKKKPKKCSICGQEKVIYKSLKQGLTNFSYCRECYDDYYKKIEDRVKAQVMAEAKAGHKIGMKEALAITKEITAEVEVENEKEFKKAQKNE